MQTIGDKLRTAREAQGRTLDDVSAETRINRRFLDELERGIVPNVPMTYVRAFVRSYASAVGLNADELLRDASLTPPPPQTIPTPAAAEEPPPVPARAEEAPPPESPPDAERSRNRQPAVLIVISILLLFGLLLTVVMLRQERPGPSPQEIPFSDVVKEQEAKAAPVVVSRDTVVKKAAQPAPIVTRRDSLVLECATKESVWVRVVVDGGSALEYTFPPQYKIRWKAKKNFLLSLGSAGGVTLTLNGKPVGGLGSSKKPIRNMAISWDTYQALVSPKQGSVQ